MSFTTEPTPKTDPTPNGQANGYTPPGPSPLATGKGASHKTLPSRGASGSRTLPFALGGLFLFAAIAGLVWYFAFRPDPARADVLLHTVKREPLVVSVTEKGTIESADNRDIVCRVRAGTKGYASTINWVIEDGARVKPGQLLMILDDSALKDKEQEEQIEVLTAQANKVKADKDYEITIKTNKLNIATAEAALITADNDLKNYLGLNYDSSRASLAALGGGPLSLTEAGTFRQEVDDLTGQVRLAESTVEQNRERAAWADRMVKLSYLSPAQAQAEQSRLDSSVETLRSLKAKLYQLVNSTRDQTLTKFLLARDSAAVALEKAKLEADANLDKALAEKLRATAEFVEQDAQLRDIVQQRAECKIYAPTTIEPDSMVVYYKNESSRWRSSSEGMIEQGAQVKEGQKMLRIPNLRRMQVNTKVHEAMVARIRGDVWQPTHFVDGLQQLMILNTDSFGRLVGQRQEIIERLREQFRNESYKKISDGQKATIRVDALPDRIFEGHVRTVAAVASQADSWISDTKLYQTLVTIDTEVLPDGTRKPLEGERLRPDMTAEVTITVDVSSEPVLTVPIQSIIGGTEMGAKREVYVKTPTGYERKPVSLGLYNDKVVEIREGLAEGDQVVINPKVLMEPDDKTRTREADGKARGGKGEGGKGDYPKGDFSKGEGAPGARSKGEGDGAGVAPKTGSKTGFKSGRGKKTSGSGGPPPSDG